MKKEYKTFDDSFEPKVGSKYMVYCAELENYGGKRAIYVPIINFLHKDPQFGVNIFHYHIDGRFATEEIKTIFDVIDGKTNFIIHAEPVTDYANNFRGVVLKPKVCKRQHTGIDPPITQKSRRYWDWYETMKGKPVKVNKCPHHGTLMHDKGDTLVCPLHGLSVCKKTKLVIDPEFK